MFKERLTFKTKQTIKYLNEYQDEESANRIIDIITRTQYCQLAYEICQNEILLGEVKEEAIKNAVLKVLQNMKEKDRILLSKYYGIEGFEMKTVSEIAREYNVSKNYISLKLNGILDNLFTNKINFENLLVKEYGKIICKKLIYTYSENGFERKIIELDENDVEKNEYDINYPIEMLCFSKRVFNILKRAQISTIEDLLKLSKERISKISQAGESSIREIFNKVEEIKTSLNIKENDLSSKQVVKKR